MAAPPGLFTLTGTSWGGAGARWSTFEINVGNPPQAFAVLPSTSAPFTMVPNFDGSCLEGKDPDDCPEIRGISQSNQNPFGFDQSESDTWRDIDFFNLQVAANLTPEANTAFFGIDKFNLPSPGGDSLNVDEALIGTFTTLDFLVGMIGLDPFELTLDDNQASQPNLMLSLKSAGDIDSLSWSYTAGAAYRPNKPPAHLCLGGYDATLVDAEKGKSIEIPFNDTSDRPLTVALQGILAERTFTGATSLLSEEIFSIIDSTLPLIWLPKETCDLFARAFRLDYDEQTGLYLVNDTVHEDLIQLKPTITFRLGADFTSGQSANIELPYAAFDMQIDFPLYDSTKNYFPIHRATKPDQFVIGRTFLQEAYLIADYESKNFTVTQVVPPGSDTKPDMRVIPALGSNSTAPGPPPAAPTSTSSTPPNSPRVVPVPAIIAISVGGTFLVTLYFSVMFLRRRRQRRKFEEQRGFAKDIEWSPIIVNSKPIEADSRPGIAEFDSPDGEKGTRWCELQEGGSSRPQTPQKVLINKPRKSPVGLHELGVHSREVSLEDDLVPAPLRPARAKSKGLPQNPRETRSPTHTNSRGDGRTS